jgi:hypothetical protein
MSPTTTPTTTSSGACRLPGRSAVRAVHASHGPGDVTDDDDGVHLVLLPTTQHHVPNVDQSPAITMADQILAQRNAGPRLNRNLLVFCAASEARLAELHAPAAPRGSRSWKTTSTSSSKQKGDEAQAKSKINETDETVTQLMAEIRACTRARADRRNS